MKSIILYYGLESPSFQYLVISEAFQFMYSSQQPRQHPNGIMQFIFDNLVQLRTFGMGRCS